MDTGFLPADYGKRVRRNAGWFSEVIGFDANTVLPRKRAAGEAVQNIATVPWGGVVER